MRSYLAVAAAVAFAACGGASQSAPPPAAPAAPCPTVQAPPPPTIDEAAVKEKSHALFDAIDKADVAAFDASTTATFIGFRQQRFFDKAVLLQSLKGRGDKKDMRTRTWQDERVYLANGLATFIGNSIEHSTGENGKAIDTDGWVTLVWIPDGATWKVAHYQWQKGGLDAERDVWNATYEQGGRFKQTANQLLIDTIKGRKPGTALDLGMGAGRNSLHLAEKGWRVTGIDIADAGIRIAQEAAAKKKLKIEGVVGDMQTWDFGKDKWDLVAMIYEGGDRPIIEKAKASLKKGGIFVLEYFSSESAIAPKMGIGGIKPGELAELFKGWKILKDEVAEDVADFGGMKDKLARFVAEKP